MARSAALVIPNHADLQQLRIKPWSFGQTLLALFHLPDEDQTLHSAAWFTLNFAPGLMPPDHSHCMHSSFLPVYSGGEQPTSQKLEMDFAVVVFACNRPWCRLWRKTMVKTIAHCGGPAHLMPSNSSCLAHWGQGKDSADPATDDCSKEGTGCDCTCTPGCVRTTTVLSGACEGIYCPPNSPHCFSSHTDWPLGLGLGFQGNTEARSTHIHAKSTEVPAVIWT